MRVVTEIVLASTSRYRRQLLERLAVPFEVAAPRVDETPVPGEPPDARALRLAEEKAGALVGRFGEALILGGDQTIADGDVLFDKPGTVENAAAQLLRMRGRTLVFFTAVALVAQGGREVRSCLVVHRARVRRASEAEIWRYVRKENAVDCAGGAQIEGLGIALMADIRGGDPTALVGMPLMEVARMLRAHGVEAP